MICDVCGKNPAGLSALSGTECAACATRRLGWPTGPNEGGKFTKLVAGRLGYSTVSRCSEDGPRDIFPEAELAAAVAWAKEQTLPECCLFVKDETERYRSGRLWRTVHKYTAQCLTCGVQGYGSRTEQEAREDFARHVRTGLFNGGSRGLKVR